MIKGSIQEEGIKIINICAPNIGAPQYIRQILKDIKGKIDCNTIIVGDLNTPLTSIDRSPKQKIDKETSALKDTSDQVDLTDIYRIFHPKATECIFFSCDRTFSEIDHILGHQTHINQTIKN